MSTFTYTQKTNEVYADSENACYSEETVEFNVTIDQDDNNNQ